MVFQENIDDIKAEDLEKFFKKEISEGVMLDYKLQMPSDKDLVKYAVCYSNGNGGFLIIGIDADKKLSVPQNVSGITIPDGLKDRIVQVVRDNTTPPIIPHVIIKEIAPSKNIVIFEILPGEPGEIYRTKNNKTYFRTEEQCIPLPEQIIRKIRSEKNDRERIERFEEDIIWMPHENIDIKIFDVAVQCRILLLPYEPFNNMIDTVNKELRDSIKKSLLLQKNVIIGNNEQITQDGYIIEKIYKKMNFIHWEFKKRGFIKHEFLLDVQERELPIIVNAEVLERRTLDYDELERYIDQFMLAMKDIYSILNYKKKIRIILDLRNLHRVYLDSSNRFFAERWFRLPFLNIKRDVYVKNLIESPKDIADDILREIKESVGIGS